MLISQLLVLGKPADLYYKTINIKITFFNDSNLSKTVLNVSPLLSWGFEICPYEDDYGATINRNSLCVTDPLLRLNYTGCTIFPIYIYTRYNHHTQNTTKEILTPIMSELQTKT